MELFYSKIIHEDLITLDAIESNHCLKVLRHSIGDLVNVVDGKGTLFKGKIVLLNKNNCKIKVEEIFKNYNSRNYYIHIAISPLKNHRRIEWFIEKSVEIGIDEISFIECSRTIRKKININRLNKTAISAMKQSLSAKIPKINSIVSINEFLENNSSSNKFICHLQKGSSKTIFDYKQQYKLDCSSSIMIGPEGDFTINEINFAKKNKFSILSLGRKRLRTETAGFIACHLLNIINENYE